MISEEFTEKIADLVKGRLDNAAVHVHNTTKNNGVHLTGLVIQEKGSNVSPCIYLESFHSEYESGDKNMETIAEEIICFHRKNKAMHNLDVSMFTDYSHACLMLRGRLINTEKNAEFLKDVPHREFLDLSLIYCVEIPCPDNQGVGSVQVREEHMKLWGVAEQELYRQVMENMAIDRASIINIAEMLADMRGLPFGKPPEEGFSMYVLTNQCKCNGAVQMLNKKALEEAAGLFGSDFFILPSSVHETILVSVEESEDTPGDLARMVHEVNETVLSEGEFLSSHVYRYCAVTGQIQLVA